MFVSLVEEIGKRSNNPPAIPSTAPSEPFPLRPGALELLTQWAFENMKYGGTIEYQIMCRRQERTNP
jgi:hypothetical protein